MNPDATGDRFELEELHGALETEACIGLRVLWYPTWLPSPAQAEVAA